MRNRTRMPLADPFIIVLALFSIAFHLAFSNNLEYHRDEMLYFSLGQHLSAGYATVPPLIGWLGWLMQTLFGYSVFAVRLLPALVSGAMILLAGSMARELGGSRYASFLAALGLLISIFFLRTYFLFMPVFLDVFLWTLTLFLIIKYINTLKDRFLILLGIAVGFALLNKYLVGILLAGLVLIVPFTLYREIFRKKMFWLASAIGFLIFLPNLIWQISRGFPVFSHLSELYRTQLVHMDSMLFLKEQLIMASSGSVFTVAGLIYLLFSKKSEGSRFLGFLALFVIFVLMILKAKSYYTLGIFPLLIVAGAVAYDHWLKSIWIRAIFPILLILTTIPVIPFGLPVYNSKGMVEYFNVLDKKYHIDLGRRFEDGTIHSLPQDYADMLGWEELTEITNRAWQKIDDKRAAFIYCENYGQAGAITIIGKKYGLPEPVCFNESFRYWCPESFDPEITSFIYINGELGEDVSRIFRKITEVGKISNPDAREFGTTIFLCEDPAVSFNKFWKERLESLNR